MVALIVIDTKNERANVYRYKSDDLAFKYVSKLYHIPPQRRYVIAIHVQELGDNDMYLVNKMSQMISEMIPSDRDTMEVYSTYPTYVFNKWKE